MTVDRNVRIGALAIVAGLCLLGSYSYVTVGAQEAGPRYKVDADWPKRPLPNKWFMGGITGLDVDQNDNVWVLNRPADLDETENYATLNPPSAECCVAAPTIIAFNPQGDVIASFSAPQGHGSGQDRQHGQLRRPVPRPAHDRDRFEGEHLYRRGAGRRTGPEVRPDQLIPEFTCVATTDAGQRPMWLRKSHNLEERLFLRT